MGINDLQNPLYYLVTFICFVIVYVTYYFFFRYALKNLDIDRKMPRKFFFLAIAIGILFSVFFRGFYATFLAAFCAYVRLRSNRMRKEALEEMELKKEL